MKTILRLVVFPLFLTSTASLRAQTRYPHASLDQATREIKGELRIERLADLTEAELETEYHWALEMADLSLNNILELCERDWELSNLAFEFQRHAGRTARYRGFHEQAVGDYQTAILYVYETERILRAVRPPHDTERHLDMVWRDIADTYVMMGTYEAASELTRLILERMSARGEYPPGGSSDVYRLAEVAERQGLIGDSMKLLWEALQLEHADINRLANACPELDAIDLDRPWDQIIRSPEMHHLLSETEDATCLGSNGLKRAYCRLGRAMRLCGLHDDAEYTIETAEFTPWKCQGTCREHLDLEVDREWAFLWLAQGKAEEALEKAEECLEKYSASMHPSEKVELLDLVSRAMEQLGDVSGALEKLEEAVGIVEEKRANLVSDEFKQSFAAGYAPLYRRALELVVRLESEVAAEFWSAESRRAGTGTQGATERRPTLGLDATSGTADTAVARASIPPNHGQDARATERAFEWSERVKGRAMLDAANRYDQMMARAIATSDTDRMRSIREQTARVVSIDKIRDSTWLRDDTAILAFEYGARATAVSAVLDDAVRATHVAHCSQSSGTRGFAYGEPRVGQTPSSVDLAPAAPVYAWVISKKHTVFRKLPASSDDIDKLCRQLIAALPQQDDGWVAPAARLYALTVAPVADQLQGIKRLVIVADGALRTVPFEVFISQPAAGAPLARWNESRRASGFSFPAVPFPHRLLIEDYTISYAPSATLLHTINERPRPADWQHTLWAFASTRFGYEEPRAARSPGAPGARAAPVRADQCIGQSVATTPRDNPAGGSDVVRTTEPATPGSAAQEAPSMTIRDILRTASTLNLPDLRNTRREIEDAAQAAGPSKARTWIDHLNMKDVILAANGSAELKSVRLLHFATHAFVDEDRPYLCGLMLCPPFPDNVEQPFSSVDSARATAVSAVHVGQPLSSVDSADGHHDPAIASRGASRFWGETLRSASGRPERLTLHEIAALDLQSDLVVLGACRSIGQQRVDGDWLSGLARAFLVAGSSGVVCTLWETGDRLSADFMPGFYNALLSGPSSQALDAPAALQELKTSLLKSPSLCHPANWAAFVYVGRI